MATPATATGSAGGAGGGSSLDAAMSAGLASMEEMMAKQIEFTTKANPLKAGDSVAKGSRMG